MDLTQELIFTSDVLSDIKFDELKDYTKSDKPSYEIVAYLNQMNSSKKEAFIEFFKDKLNIPWWIAKDLLECSKTELMRWKEQLGFSFTKRFITQYMTKGTRDYFYLGKVLNSKAILENLRAERKEELKSIRKEAGSQAAKTKQYRKENMPDFISKNDLVLPEEICNLKRFMAIAKLAKEDVAYECKCTFGKAHMKFFVSSNGIGCFLLKIPYDFKMTIKLNTRAKNIYNDINKKFKSSMNSTFFSYPYFSDLFKEIVETGKCYIRWT